MKTNTKGFTLVEIVIVVLVIGILMAVAIPGMLHARSNSQAKTCVQNLLQIEQAKEEYGMANRLNDGASILMEDLVPGYIKAIPTCPAGGVYTLGVIGQNPNCSLGDKHTLEGTGFGEQGWGTSISEK